MVITRRALVFVFALTLAQAVLGASFVVPEDRSFIHKAPAIVVASALSSRAQLDGSGVVETITTISIEEVIKGSIDGDTLDLYELGGVVEGRATMFPGVPRFKDGERYLLFLMKDRDGRWHVLDLILGKFDFATDILGHDLLIRHVGDVLILDSDGSRHQESHRAAEPFLNFIRATVRGGPTKENYTIPAEPLVGVPSVHRSIQPNRTLRPMPLAIGTGKSYTSSFDGTNTGTGGRWCGTIVLGSCTVAFPSAIHFGSIGSEGGAPGSPAGTAAIGSAMTAWNGAPGATINYVYDGNDATNTTNQPSGGSCAGGTDNKNTVALDYDLSCKGIMPVSCSPGSFGGTLGLGGITLAVTPTHTGPNGDAFYTTVEVDVWMNKGMANCTFPGLFTDFWPSAVTHEVGHTLGFRHADQTRADDPMTACETDVSLECAGTVMNPANAIMRSFVSSGIAGALQLWDQHAAAALYPAPAAPPAVTGVEAHSTSATNVQVNWSGSCATVCHIYRSKFNDKNTFDGPFSSLGATGPFNDTAGNGVVAGRAYFYKVRNFNGATESLDSNLDLATTVFPTNSLTPQVSVIMALDVTEIRNGTNAVETLAGVVNTGYTDPTLDQTVTVKKVHIDEPLTRLNNARGMLGLGAVSLSGGAIVQFTTPVRASDINDVRGGFR